MPNALPDNLSSVQAELLGDVATRYSRLRGNTGPDPVESPEIGRVTLPGGEASLTQELVDRTGCSPEFAADAVRYYLIAADAEYTHEDFVRRYNSDLANDIAGSLNRSLAMAQKFGNGVVPDAEIDSKAAEAVGQAKSSVEAAMEQQRPGEAANAVVALGQGLNKYIDASAPWLLAKNQDPKLPSVLRSMLFWLRGMEGLLRPIMPTVANAIARQVGLPPLADWNSIGTEAAIPPGGPILQPEAVFPKLDTKKAAALVPEKKPAAAQPAPVEEISIEEFMKVQLKLGRVLEAEPLEGSDKLMKLQVILGQERRQIVAGIRKNYSPEDIVGMQVVVVANLKPAKLRGIESQGMLLAAVDAEGGAILLTPEKEAPEGALVR